MERREYNGWTNYETWLVNMWYGDYLQDIVNEGETLDADQIEAIVVSMMSDYDQLPENGFVADIMNAALRQIDWEDLASHYELEEESEDA
jgi:hypothetical protein